MPLLPLLFTTAIGLLVRLLQAARGEERSVVDRGVKVLVNFMTSGAGGAGGAGGDPTNKEAVILKQQICGSSGAVEGE